MLLSLVNISWLPATPTENVAETEATTGTTAEAAVIYSKLGLAEKGLSQEAFDYALKGYQRLVDKQKIHNPGILTICDFSQSSAKKRLYLVDLENEKILMNTYVAHGRNSGSEFATKFSNTPNSLQSSLGFYVTQNTYSGEHGLSLKIAGMEPGFNSNAMERAVVVHGADYIGGNRLKSSSFMGRSFGCPAVPANESARIINMIKNGTCLFIYHPSASNYLNRSNLLNG